MLEVLGFSPSNRGIVCTITYTHSMCIMVVLCYAKLFCYHLLENLFVLFVFLFCLSAAGREGCGVLELPPGICVLFLDLALS